MENISILILGVGEPGMNGLGNMARQAAFFSDTTGTLLRSSTVALDPEKQQSIDKLRSIRIGMIYADFVTSANVLSNILKDFHTVISCTGFVTGVIYSVNSPVPFLVQM